jgi:hypothetical protein
MNLITPSSFPAIKERFLSNKKRKLAVTKQRNSQLVGLMTDNHDIPGTVRLRVGSAASVAGGRRAELGAVRGSSPRSVPSTSLKGDPRIF